MRIRNKLTAIYTAFVVTVTSCSSIHYQRIIVNAETNKFEAPILTESLELWGQK